MNKKLALLLSLLTLMLLSACGNNDITTEKEPDGQLSIYTTVYPLQYFTERIGGDAVNVHSIYPPGTDEHSFEPTQKDMIALADADVFFYIGLGLEGFVEKAEKTMKGEHVKMIATAENISEELLEGRHEEEEEEEEEEGHDEHEHEHAHGPTDPHVWMSPTLSIELATAIKDALIDAKPDMKDEFERNFEALQANLIELDGQFKEMATHAPSKTFYVSHAAFGYLAEPYGLEQVAIAGLSSQSEPSQKQLAKIVQQAKEQNIHYVLFEQNVSSKLTEVVRKEIGAESLMLHNLGVLSADDVKNNEDYFSLMEYNIETLKKALH